MQIFISIIGYLAGILAIITFVPQAIKTIKTKETKHLSLQTYIIYNIANSFFLLIGVLSIALPIMHPENATQTAITLWGLTLILPYAATIIGVNCIIYIKVQNIRKNGESSKKTNTNEEPLIASEVI